LYRQSPYLQHKDYKNFREQGEATIIVPLADVVTFFRRRILREKVRIFYTDKKENQNFLTYKEIQNGAVENSYMRKGFLLYEEMRKYCISVRVLVCGSE
jgi:hypothetical protein